MKIVPNRISYLHEFFWNFSQLLAICFELFSSGSVFNSENCCHGVPPISLSLSAPGPLISKPYPHGCHVPVPTPCLKGAVLITPRPSAPRAIAFAASTRVSALRRRVFMPSRPCSPLFLHRVIRLPAASPLLHLLA
jgi:hypothetical protein